jgi:hypothetical protein
MTITDLITIVSLPMLGAVLGMTFRLHIVLHRIEAKVRELELLVDSLGEAESKKREIRHEPTA